MNGKKVIRVLFVVIAVVVIATVIAYYSYMPEKEWLAFFIACCGGVLVVNLILSIIFVNKNFRKKR
ncbi:MAG: hypothetical protein LBD53_08730 [Tannerella sp.]|nr:hypothetical protein [Tannerella sp.]